MVIHTDSSIVPDSTISSSPLPSISPVVKRATFTYGRRKDPQFAPDPDSSATLAESSSSSRPIAYSTGHFDFDEEVPPSSDPPGVPESSGVTRVEGDIETPFSFTRKKDVNKELNDGFDGDESPISPARSDNAGSSNFEFSWKAQLKLIDEDDSDDPDQPMVPPGGRGSSNALHFSEKQGIDAPMSLTSSLSSKDTQPLTMDDVFGGSLSSQTGPSSPALSLSASGASRSATPDIRVAKRTQKRAVVIDSDDDLGDSSFGSVPHPINTPKLRSSPTPPTSDTDLSAAKPQSKGKGKAPVKGVPSLMFDKNSEIISKAPYIKKSTHKGKLKDQESHPKIKAPTKKELKETQIDKQRIIADKKVQIARTELTKHTVEQLFQTIQVQWQTVDSKHSEKLPPSSDPIFPFTSSPADPDPAVASSAPSFDFGAPSKLLAPPFKPPSKRRLSEPLTSARRVGVSGVIPALEDDDDDLPDVTDLLAAEDKKQKAKQLAEFKRLALANQKAHIVPNDDDDDDLVVESDMHAVADEEAGERRVRHAKHIRPSEGRKRQLMLGGIGSSKADKGHQEGLARTKRIPLDLLKESARPAFQSGAKHGKDGTAGLTPAELNRLVMERAERDRTVINKQKEDEWTKKGGKVIRDVEVAEVKETDGWSAILERGGKGRDRAQMEVDEDEANGSDEDWVPELRGSASPEPEEAGSGDDDGVASEAEVAMDVLTDRDDDAADDKENSRPRRPRRVAPHRAVLDSDEEDDAETENVRPLQSNPSIGQILVPDTSFAENTLPLIRMPGMIHRGSLSSFDEPTEDENDKENNTQLMFDKSEDKENKAVVRHSPLPARSALGPRGGSLFGLEERTRRALSMSPSAVELSDDDHRRADDESDRPRSPLKELRDEDDPFAFSPSFTTRLQRPTLSGLASPSPVIGSQGTIGFSQFLGEDSEPAADVAKCGLQPGFSDIFKSGSSPSVVPFKPSDSGGFSQWPEDQTGTGLDKLRRAVGNTDELSLTLDVGLQPALEVDENRLRQADAIFEKEQAYLVEAANRKPKTKPELYVNDHGFLTQTRPDVSSPEIYRVASPSQTQVGSTLGFLDDIASHSTQRHPLRTISVDSVLDSEEGRPLKRLRRRDESPAGDVFSVGYGSTSPRLPKQPMNAFEQMRLAQEKQEKAAKKKLEKSEFVEAEAEESDDDDQFGFGGHKKLDDGEEEDGEDQDKTLEGLVDDAAMDDETLAEDLVLEKVKEHQEEDDKVVEKIHRDAVEGKMRIKRRGGISLDDDSDEDEDDEADKRRRRIMAKRRKIDGDNLDELAAHPETRPFFDAYQRDLVDDNDEFANLRSEDVVMSSDNENAEEEPTETFSHDDIRRAIREAAQRGDAPEPLDPHDVQWVDKDDDDDNDECLNGVKSVSTRVVPYHRPNRSQGDMEFISQRPSTTFVEPDRMQKWAKSEARTKNNGTGRSAVGAAVTGHKAKVKAGGGSLRTLPSGSTSSAPVTSRKLVKTASVLSTLSDKRGQFA